MNLAGYFDYNATTPLSDMVRSAMLEAMERFDNPSAFYAPPDGAKALIAQARADVAALVGAVPEQIVFTSGATESNNWVIRAVLGMETRPGCFVTSAIEHDATLAAGRVVCAENSRKIHEVPPDGDGIIQPSRIRETCRGETALMSVMLANNETGVIQPIREIAQVAAEKDAFFHVDAVQAAGKMAVDVDALDCDALSLSAHKFHGPKGVGALYLKEPASMTPLIVGGGQEGGLRAGTENIIGIAGMGVAAAEAKATLAARIAQSRELRAGLLKGLRDAGLAFTINGAKAPKQSVPNTLNVSFEGIRAEALAARLALCDGIAVSLGSACSTNKDRRHSHVLQAMGLDEARLMGALRISFGRYTTRSDIGHLVASLAHGIRVMKKMAAE